MGTGMLGVGEGEVGVGRGESIVRGVGTGEDMGRGGVNCSACRCCSKLILN